MLSIIIVYFEVLYQRELSFFFSFFCCREYDIRLIDRCLLKQLTLKYRSLHSRYFFPFFLHYCRKFLLNERPMCDIVSIPSSENNNNNFSNSVLGSWLIKRCCATRIPERWATFMYNYENFFLLFQ